MSPYEWKLVLVHPVRSGDSVHLPCAYGYATTIRRAQGSSLDQGCLFFDHSYPPERGYGYVGASRFRTRDGLFLFGKIRRSDWLPVGSNSEHEQTRRGVDSESCSEDDFIAEQEEGNLESNGDSEGSDEGNSEMDESSDDEFDNSIFQAYLDGLDDTYSHDDLDALVEEA